MNNDNLNKAEFNQSLFYIFISVLFRRKWLIGGFFIIAIFLVTLTNYLLPPVFRSTTELLLEREIDYEKAFLFKMNLFQRLGTYEWIRSEIEIIKSYSVIAPIVKKLNLDQNKINDKNLTLTKEVKLFEKIVKDLRNELQIENPRESNILRISYEHKDPLIAKAVLRTLIETYISHRSNISDQIKDYNFFNEQIKFTNEKLIELEKKQANFKQSRQVISPKEQIQILLTKLADYEKALTVVETKRISKESKLAIIKKQLKNGQDISIPSTETSDSPSHEKHIAKLKGDLLDMENKREYLLQKFSPEYKEIITLNKQISATKEKILKEVKQIINMEQVSILALKAEEEVLKKSLENIKQDIDSFTQKEYEYIQMSRGIDENREIYSMFLKQREEARIAQAKSEKDIKIKIVCQPTTPAIPSKPRKTLNILLAIILGLTGGLGIAFLVDYYDHSIKTPMELRQLLGIPVLGYIREMKQQVN